MFATNKVAWLRTVCLVFLLEFRMPTLYMVSIERPVDKFLNLYFLRQSFRIDINLIEIISALSWY